MQHVLTIWAVVVLSFVSLGLVLGALGHGTQRGSRTASRADLDAWAAESGDPLKPATWPHTGRITADGLPVLLSPAGERVVVEPDGRIVPAFGRGVPDRSEL